MLPHFKYCLLMRMHLLMEIILKISLSLGLSNDKLHTLLLIILLSVNHVQTFLCIVQLSIRKSPNWRHFMSSDFSVPPLIASFLNGRS